MSKDSCDGVLTVLPYQIIGYRDDGRPIYAIAGAADPPEDEIEGGEDETAEDEIEVEVEEEEPPEKVAPPTPPAKKAPAKQLPAKAGETRLEVTLRREREARKTAEAQLRTLQQANETDADKRQREAEEAAQAKYKPTAIKAVARAALIEAKYKKSADSGVRLIDMELVDVDEDGNITGLEDQIAWLKTEYAELFESDVPPQAKPAAKRTAPKIDAGNKPPVEDQPKSSAERIAASVLGR